MRKTNAPNKIHRRVEFLAELNLSRMESAELRLVRINTKFEIIREVKVSALASRSPCPLKIDIVYTSKRATKMLVPCIRLGTKKLFY